MEKDGPPRERGGSKATPVLMWSAKGPVRYVCIEPWHGLPDAHGQRHLGGKSPTRCALRLAKAGAPALR